jgi:hypothetical protein
MAKNLDELKEELYEAFNTAKRWGDQFRDRSLLSSPSAGQAAAASYEAAAKSAAAIVKVEREIRERDEAKSGMKLPGKN